MKPLLIIFVLCGSPDKFIAHDELGVMFGYLNRPNPVEIRDRIMMILRNPQTIKRKVATESITGDFCV